MSIVFRTQSNEEDGQPLYRRVEAYIESYIQTQGLHEGDLIPSLDTLCSSLGVSNITVRRAVSELCQKGVLVTRQGMGTIVARPRQRRVMWVNEVDVNNPDVSPFFPHHLQVARRMLSPHGLNLEPFWLSPHDDVKHRIDRRGLDGFDGFIFSECATRHRTLQEVMAGGRPYVDLSSRTERELTGHNVTVDTAAVDRLALTTLREHGHRHVAVLTFGAGGQDRFRSLGEELGLDLSLGEIVTAPRQSTVEAGAFQLASAMFDADRLDGGVYITDDVAARGVTRAILAAGKRHLPHLELIAFAARQEVMDLGLPVTYLSWNIEDQVRVGATRLLDQINGGQPPAQPWFCPITVMPMTNSDEAAGQDHEDIAFRITSLAGASHG